MSYLQLGTVISMTDYQSAVASLAREKSIAYFSTTPMDWNLLRTEIENIASKYNVPIDKVDDDVSSEYKASVKRTVEYASRNNAVLFSRTDTKFKG